MLSLPWNNLVFLRLMVASLLIPGQHALIISPSPHTEQALSWPPANPDFDTRRRQKHSVARIRSTRRSDIENISDLLSSAIAGDTNENWKARIERLRVKSSVKSNLDLRVRAIEETKKLLSRRIQTTEGDITLSLNDPNHLRYLWTLDSFRNKIEQAAERSSEPHPWEHHNFAVAPEDPSWVRHQMITAEDTETGEILGFCEVAMLLCPQMRPQDSGMADFANGVDYQSDELCAVQCAPTIANLVVSPNWRRRGIAKALVKSAENFVQRCWGSNVLGLYVVKTNAMAVACYFSAGYEVLSSFSDSDKDEPDKWYMAKQLRQVSRTSQEFAYTI